MSTARLFQPTTVMGVSRGLGAWMQSCGVSLVFLSQADGRIGVIDLAASARPVLREQIQTGCGALAVTVDRRTIVCDAPGGLARLHRARRGEFAPLVSEPAWPGPEGGSAVLAVLGDGRPVVAARAGLVALSPCAPPTVIWQRPAALRDLALTGVAVDEDGRAAYATASRERGDGLVVDLQSGEVAIAGLRQPAAPRFENGWLWFVDLDRDDLCVADPGSGLCETVTRCPGRVRGLALVGDRAVVGLSPARTERPRWQNAPGGFHGLAVIDTHCGSLAEWLALEGLAGTIDDVALIAARPRDADVARRAAAAAHAPPV